MDEVAIRVRNLSKTFSIRENGPQNIRTRVTQPFRKSVYRTFKAIDNLTFDVNKGDFFAIVGHNGSGKSTLLKCILGAFKPDVGSLIKSNGTLMRLSLGMGFNYNLSARHNIYINGSIMGMTFKEIGRSFNSIIDFSGLKEFVDTPIKYYSTGMVSRLAFSIAVNADVDILLVDEFFGGVGDEDFRQKSETVFRERIIKGKTVVMVSHNLNIITQNCNKGIMLEKGSLIIEGEISKIIDVYKNSYKSNKKD